MSMMRERCKKCGHAYSFHGRAADAPCRAVGCKKGPGGKVCQGFIAGAEASKEIKAHLRDSRKAQKGSTALSG